MRRLLLRLTLALLVLLVLVAAGGAFWLHRQLNGSLAVLDGDVPVAGLAADVRVERDALGIPTITAGSLDDAARTLGFLHAQERFFQMDLQRRQPAGELAALVGAAALDADRDARRHSFRRAATAALARMAPDYRARLEAYAAGVNAGLAALDAPPFEYLLLRTSPAPWLAEDVILSGLAIYNDLQNPAVSAEPVLAVMSDVLPAPLTEFLAARASDWESPVDGLALPVAAVPGPEVIDLRTAGRAATPRTPEHHARLLREEAWLEEEATLGSNNWVVAGDHTATGAALVANDMHLRIAVPNIWYRASIVVPDPARPGETLRFTGVTLPGMPVWVVGSNGHIAWGFTNSQADWHDLVVIDPDPDDPTRYLTPDGPRAFDTVVETIRVKGASDERLETRWTIWGPVWDTDHRGRARALRWIAHDAEILARPVDPFALAHDVNAALLAAAHTSLPGQNLVVGDRDGRIGWTLAGTLPNRVGFTGEVPVSWADGTRGWQGWVSLDDHPRIVAPAEGRLWTANARVVGGEMLARLGEGNYADGIRARVIRERLLALERPTPADMLAIQTSGDGRFLARWRERLLAALTPDAVAASPGRAEFRRLLDTTWTGEASVDSVAYRLTREARAAISRAAFEPFARLWQDVAPEMTYARMRRAEGPLWRLVTEEPAHLLDAAYPTWDALVLAAIDETIAALTTDGRALADRTWGEANRAAIGHPLASAIPLVGDWLRMPADPLPGDVYTPRASSPRTGASQRMAVTPGRESEGIMVMPVGQSGHPWSPYFRSQHEAWVNGTPLPFLPGETVHTLTLKSVVGGG